MKILALAVLLLTPQSLRETEVIALKREFINATEEYKANLIKLLPYYESAVTRTEERLETAKRLLSDGAIPRRQFDDIQADLEQSKQRIEEVKKALRFADEQIASLPSDEDLIKQYKKDKAAQLRAAKRSKRCRSWTLTAKQVTSRDSISFSYRFVCQN